jgi:hypothetical protein
MAAEPAVRDPLIRTSTGSIGEAATGFPDKEHSRGVIPCVVTLGQEAVDLATTEWEQRQRARWRSSRTRWQRALDSSSRASSTASASVDVVLALRCLVRLSSRGQGDSKDPPPRIAHQQRRNAGEVTTATFVAS